MNDRQELNDGKQVVGGVCPTCGSSVRTETSDDGTSFYVPADVSIQYQAARDALEELAKHHGAVVEWDSEGMPSLAMGKQTFSGREA